MEFSGEGVSVYAEAKGEYTRQLCQYLVPAVQKFFLEMLETVKEQQNDSKKHLLNFQTQLEGVVEWNIDKVQRETQRISLSTQCDYIEELLTAVFIAHTKVLSAIRLTNKQKKLQITIPKLEHFLHRTLTECARHLWSNTYLFSTACSSIERQKNMRQIESLITEGVLQGIRTMLPVKSILREYLSTEESDSSESESENDVTDNESIESKSHTADISNKAKKNIATPLINPIKESSDISASIVKEIVSDPIHNATNKEIIDVSSPANDDMVSVFNFDTDETPTDKNTIVTAINNESSHSNDEELQFIDNDDDIQFEDIEEISTIENPPPAEESLDIDFEEIA